MSNVTSLRMRVLPRYPAHITGTDGIKVERDTTGAPDLIVRAAYDQLGDITAIPDAATNYFMMWDRDNNLYRRIPFQSMFDSAGVSYGYPTITAAEGINIPVVVHAIEVYGDAAVGDGRGGLYIDTDNGASKTFVSGDGRTWYLSGDVSEERLTEALAAKINGAMQKAANLSDLADKGAAQDNMQIGGAFADVATAQGATIPARNKRLRTQFYATANLNGGANYRRISFAGLAGYPTLSYFRSVDRFMPDGSTDNMNGGYWVLDEIEPDIRMFGGKLDGTTDNKNATIGLFSFAALTGVTAHITRGVLGTTALSLVLPASLSVHCEATIKNLSGAALASNLVNLEGNNKAYSIAWEGGKFDGNGGPRTLLRLGKFDVVNAKFQEAWGITCDVASPSVTSAYLIQEANVINVYPGYVHDLAEGASLQGSIPRCVSVNDCPNVDIFNGLFKNGHGGVVGNKVTVRLHNTTMQTLTDNGIYFGAGNITLYNCVLDGAEEPLVASDFGDGGGTITMQGGAIVNSTNALGLQGGRIRLFGVRIDHTLINTGNVVRVRQNGTNVVSPSLQIEGCSITAKISNAIIEAPGTNGNVLDYLRIRDSRLELIYDTDTPPPGAPMFMNWSAGGTRFECEGNSFVLSKSGAGSALSADYFFNLPAVTALSTWLSNRVKNLTGNTLAVPRFNSLSQDLIEFDDIQVITNLATKQVALIGSSVSRREFWALGVPTVGTYRKGDVIWRIEPPANSNIGWVCTAAGTPGTWKTFGTVAA
jgi:hypothetical protein